METLPPLPKYDQLRESAKRYPDLDPARVESFVLFLRVAKGLIDALDQHFAEHDLSQGRFSILLLLTLEPSRQLTPSELAERCNVTRGTITGLVTNLERSGYVRRVPSPESLRSLYVRLTEEGARHLDAFLPQHFRWIASQMQRLPTAALPELARLLALLGQKETP
jgi:DNA-binding MarR family transcriptional regulator